MVSGSNKQSDVNHSNVSGPITIKYKIIRLQRASQQKLFLSKFIYFSHHSKQQWQERPVCILIPGPLMR